MDANETTETKGNNSSDLPGPSKDEPIAECMSQLQGVGIPFDAAGVTVDHYGEEDMGGVSMTVHMGDLMCEVSFSIDEAEEFIIGFRDEIVRAKQEKLEWQTDTDPESGIADEP